MRTVDANSIACGHAQRTCHRGIDDVTLGWFLILLQGKLRQSHDIIIHTNTCIDYTKPSKNFRPLQRQLFQIGAVSCLEGSAPYWSNPPFLIFDNSGALALRTERQSARMSKIKNGGLDQYGKV